MNTLSNKQQQREIEKSADKRRSSKQYCKHRKYRDNRKTTPWDMLNYISTDFVFNLLYMMIHKRFIKFFGIDYHRIEEMLHIIRKINPPLKARELKEKINNLFDGIETEEEVIDAMHGFNYDVIEDEDKLIITNNTDRDNSRNPLYSEPKEEYILPRHVLKNFLLFRQAFEDCVLHGTRNNLDFWVYACHYLLMDNNEFRDVYGPDGLNFPYKKE